MYFVGESIHNPTIKRRQSRRDCLSPMSTRLSEAYEVWKGGKEVPVSLAFSVSTAKSTSVFLMTVSRNTILFLVTKSVSAQL